VFRCSILLLTLAGAFAQAQSFGRFGFTNMPSIDLFSVSQTGFKAKSATADEIKFWEPTAEWKATPINAMECQYTVPVRALSPSKFRVSLAAPGFEAYFPDGIGFRCASLQSPYMSWNEGSVGLGVPVPPSKWLMISFQDDQPPILLIFLGEKVSLEVSGKPGAWILKSPLDFKGWVRFLLPTGLDGSAATTVAGLGELAKRVEKLAPFWFGPAPSLKGMTSREVAGGVEATWTFDRPGAAIPLPAHAALKGGYKLAVRNKLAVLSKPVEGLPPAYSLDANVRIFFPMIEKLNGRPVVLGSWPAIPTTAEVGSPPHIFERAIRLPFAAASESLRAKGGEEVAAAMNSAAQFQEPVTKQSVPFDEVGRGYPAMAATALYWRAVHVGSADSNVLFGKARLGLDWGTWRTIVKEEGQSARTSAYLAVAGVLGTTSERVTAGLLYAGSVAARAHAEAGSRLVVLPTVLSGLFEGGESLLRSPIQQISGPTLTTKKRKNVIAISWQNPPGRKLTTVLRARARYEITDLKGIDDFKESGKAPWTLTIHGQPGKMTVVYLRDKSSDPVPVIKNFPTYVEQIR